MLLLQRVVNTVYIFVNVFFIGLKFPFSRTNRYIFLDKMRKRGDNSIRKKKTFTFGE